MLADPGAVGVARPPVPSRSGAGGLARFEAASAERTNSGVGGLHCIYVGQDRRKLTVLY